MFAKKSEKKELVFPSLFPFKSYFFTDKMHLHILSFFILHFRNLVLLKTAYMFEQEWNLLYKGKSLTASFKGLHSASVLPLPMGVKILQDQWGSQGITWDFPSFLDYFFQPSTLWPKNSEPTSLPGSEGPFLPRSYYPKGWSQYSIEEVISVGM